MVEAENAIALKFVLRDVALKALDVVRSSRASSWRPPKAIREIKVLQTSGFGGGQGMSANGTAPALGVMSPILKTVLEAGAAYPLLRELMSFAKVDKTKLSEKAKSALGELGAELTTAVDGSAAGGTSQTLSESKELIPVLEPEPEPTTNRGVGVKVSHVDSAE